MNTVRIEASPFQTPSNNYPFDSEYVQLHKEQFKISGKAGILHYIEGHSKFRMTSLLAAKYRGILNHHESRLEGGGSGEFG